MITAQFAYGPSRWLSGEICRFDCVYCLGRIHNGIVQLYRQRDRLELFELLFALCSAQQLVKLG
jgi:hypothetical protein